MQPTISQDKTTAQFQEEWFDDIVATLRADELELNTNTASPEKKKLYSSLIEEDVPEILRFSRDVAAKHFVSKMIFRYVELLNAKKCIPLSLAIDYNDSTLMVWAVVKEDDLETERKLAMCEAEVNAEFFNFGFHMTTAIVEDSDNLKIPGHYKVVKETI